MKKFIIVTDSCSDLNKTLREKYDIEYVPMHYAYDEKDYVANLDTFNESYQDFYNIMRNGKRILTSQVNALDYKKTFRKFLDEGYDILSISCSSALSSSYKGSLLVKEELEKEYKDNKILCIDSLNACLGLGLICIIASELRSEGKSIEEVYSYIEENKNKVKQEAVIENLNYLKRAGRVSVTSAFFGGMLQIKPIIISNEKGENEAVEKIKGRKNSLDRIVERMKEQYKFSTYKKVFIGHADSINEALYVKEALLNVFKDKNLEIEICEIGPIIGASVGPGTIGLYFYGD